MIIGQLIFEMSANVARLSEDMAKARSTVDQAMLGIQGAVSTAKVALAGLGVAASAAGLTSMVTSAIAAENELYELSRRTRVTVEDLSALKTVAKQSGTDMDTVAQGAQRLSRAMYEASTTGTGKAAEAFQTLGVSLTDATGRMRPAMEVMKEIGQRLTQMGDGTKAVALAQELMGRGGANLLPFLDRLAETGQLNAKITTEQAEAAHKFEVEMAKLEATGKRWATTAANAILPTLNSLFAAISNPEQKISVPWWDEMFTRSTLKINEWLIALEKGTAKVASMAGMSSVAERHLAEADRLQAGNDAIRAQQAEAALAAFRRGERASRGPGGGGGAGEGTGAAAGAAPAGLSDHDLEVWRMLKEATKEQESADRAAAKAQDEAAAAAEKYRTTMEALAEAERRAADPTRVLNQELERVAQLVNEGFLNPEEGDQRVEQISREITKVQEAAEAHDKLKTKATSATDEMIKAIEGWGRSWSRELAGVVFGTEKGMGNIKAVVLRGLQEIAAAQIDKAITRPIFDGIGGAISKLFGGASGSNYAPVEDRSVDGSRAGGGPVFPGRYLVGENGPEVLDIGAAGNVTPNNALGGMTIQQTIQVGGNVHEADIPRIIEAARQGALAGYMEMQQRGAMA